MVSEVTTTVNGQGGWSNTDEAPPVNQATQRKNRTQRARDRPPINMNVNRNASNPANTGPSQGDNAKNIGANGVKFMAGCRPSNKESSS